MKLENLIHERHKHKIAGLNDSSQAIFNYGKLVELLSKDGNIIPASLFLKKVDTPQRCLAIAEPIERRVAMLSIDKNGKILTCDDELATIFQYESSELIGADLHTLIPSVQLVNEISQNVETVHKQKLTGRTKEGASFPVSVMINRISPSQESWQVVVWVYSNLSGLIILNKDLIITNCNHYFTKLLFGLPKNQLVNQKITKLIPNFCDDLEYGRNGTGTLQSENSDSCSDRIFISESDKKTELESDSINEIKDNCDNHSGLNSEEAENNYNFIVWNDSKWPKCKKTGVRLSKSDNEIHSKCNDESGDDINVVSESAEPQEGEFFKLTKREKVRESLVDETEAETDKDLNEEEVKDGNFSGHGKHIDGTNIDIIYRVKTVIVKDKTFYSVWISRDPWEIAEGGRNAHTNLTVTSSFNSTSLEGSMTKDSYHSEQHTRPSSASIISQCDEVLTAGEYSEHYTNLQQIGKGAFGYVKMAYRNSDGFLVVTKFIKKQKINVKSWVVDPHLNMKVPLEISLLTSLQHPNIVQVLDVFHNESFFQLVMEKHGAGLDLFEFIDRKPNTDERLDSYIFRQIISAVHYLDSLGILHRDIKDENVIINERFEVKLIDFGSAAFMAPDKMFSMFYGTVEYCSPEVLQGNKYKGPELEIWALGVTLYVLTFGENPFYDVEETIKGKFSIPSPISSQLYELLHKMLEKDVEARITIDKLIKDPWINQPVEIEKYQFEEVVRCYPDEAYPPRYISEFCFDKYENPSDRGLDFDGDRTVASSNSFCSLQTLENLDGLDPYDEPIPDTNELKLRPSLNKINIPTFMMASTPIKKKDREGLTKSAGALHRTSDVPTFSKNPTYEYCNNNSIQKRFSLDLNVLAQLNGSSSRFPEMGESFKEEPVESSANPEENNELEFEIMKEFNKLKLMENGNNNESRLGNFVGNRKSKTKSTGSDDSNQPGCHEFFDTVDPGGDYECYWDAEDEKYDNDESYS